MCSQSQLLVSECQIGQHSSLAPARPGCGSKSQVIFCRAGTQPGPVRLCTGPPCYICHCQTQLIINLPPAQGQPCLCWSLGQLCSCRSCWPVVWPGSRLLCSCPGRSLMAAGRSLRLDYLKTFISAPRHSEPALIRASDNIYLFEVWPSTQPLSLAGGYLNDPRTPGPGPAPFPAVKNVLFCLRVGVSDTGPGPPTVWLRLRGPGPGAGEGGEFFRTRERDWAGLSAGPGWH